MSWVGESGACVNDVDVKIIIEKERVPPSFVIIHLGGNDLRQSTLTITAVAILTDCGNLDLTFGKRFR